MAFQYFSYRLFQYFSYGVFQNFCYGVFQCFGYWAFQYFSARYLETLLCLIGIGQDWGHLVRALADSNLPLRQSLPGDLDQVLNARTTDAVIFLVALQKYEKYRVSTSKCNACVTLRSHVHQLIKEPFERMCWIL